MEEIDVAVTGVILEVTIVVTGVEVTVDPVVEDIVDIGVSDIEMSSTYMYAPSEFPAVALLSRATPCVFIQNGKIQIPLGPIGPAFPNPPA